MSASGETDNPQIQAVADRLESKFAEENVTSKEVDDAVRESVDSFSDAPIQGFVHLLAEHKATTRLRVLSQARNPRVAGQSAR
jgi:hypothetical protein